MGESVELHAAFVWDCNSCGAENFARSITLSPEEARARLGDENYEDVIGSVHDDGYDGAQFATAPARVKCKACGQEFDAETPDAESVNFDVDEG